MTGSIHILDYELPDCDVQEEKRNFPGYQKEEYFTLQEIIHGTRYGGMTETDNETSGKTDGPYEDFQKSGKKQHVKTKTSAKSKMYNSEKAKPFKGPHRTTSR